MKMKTICELVFLIGMSYFICGCTSLPQLSKPVIKEKNFSQPFDVVWEATLKSAENAFIDAIDKDTGVVAFKAPLSGEQVKKYIIDSKKIKPMYAQGVTYINLFCEKVNISETRVYIKSMIFVNQVVRNRMISYNANSNGQLEESYFDKIAINAGEKTYDWLDK